MSPLLGFTTMRQKIEDGTKRQTIRLARKRPIKVGDTLYLYWKLRTKKCQRIGVTTCLGTLRANWNAMKAIGDFLALEDGFSSWSELDEWFQRYHPTNDTRFDVIRWDYPLRGASDEEIRRSSVQYMKEREEKP